mgnify:CR=1 FL=1
MIKQLLYLMPDPHSVDTWVKAGKTKLPTFQMRIGNYQQGNGPNYQVKWPMCWIGEKSVVDKLEQTKINEIVRGYKYKVESVDTQFLPITVDNVAEVQDHYK